MSKKLGLHISGRPFNVEVEDEFGKFLESQMIQDFNFEGNNDPKSLLLAYVRKVHEIYIQEQKLEEILNKIEKET